MMKASHLAIAATSLTLCGCVHLGLPSFGTRKPVPATVATAPPPPVCPGDLTADLVVAPSLPDGAGFLAEGAKTDAYLSWLHDFAVWARLGWARAGAAKTYCDGGKP